MSVLKVKDGDGIWTSIPSIETFIDDGSLEEAKFSDDLKLKTIKDYVTPEMFGAKGDGVADDTTAFRQAVSVGFPVVLGAGKTYMLTDGMSVGHNLVIMGNNAKILVNNYSATGDYKYDLFRGASGVSITVENLEIEFHYETTNFYADFTLFGYMFTELTLINCTINIDSTYGTPTPIFMLNAKTVTVRNCYIKNNSKGAKGGCVWLKGSNPIYATFENCYFENTSNDETVAIYGSSFNNGKFTNCKFVTSTYNTRTTIMTAFYDAPANITMENCEFINTSTQIEAAIRMTGGGEKKIILDNCEFDISNTTHILISQEKTDKVSAIVRNVHATSCAGLSRRGSISYDITNLVFDTCKRLFTVEPSYLSSKQMFSNIRNVYASQDNTGYFINLSDQNGILLLENVVVKGTDNIVYALNNANANAIYNLTQICVVNNSGTIINTFS